MALITRTTFEPHPEGVTIGQLVDYAYDEKGQFGPQIKWSFDTEEEMQDGRPFRLVYWTTPTLNEKSNLYLLLKAFGEDPEDEAWEIEEISALEPLLGRKIQIEVLHKKDAGGSIRARIAKVMGLPKRWENRPEREGGREPALAGSAERKKLFTDEED
jgi:hypothetical protein